MKIIKVIAGLGCFIAALLPGGLALLALSNLDSTEALSIFCVASILLILTIGLIYAGCFLIVRRNLPMSRRARIFTLSTCLLPRQLFQLFPVLLKLVQLLLQMPASIICVKLMLLPINLLWNTA
jgi:hypothetical protein